MGGLDIPIIKSAFPSAGIAPVPRPVPLPFAVGVKFAEEDIA